MVVPNHPESLNRPCGRGAFILLEGVDRCGKTTQSRVLLNRLLAAGLAATSVRFPDRSTATGQVINSYLTNAANNLDDRAVHLLFSANRWEAAGNITKQIAHGTTIVCDRYAYSGVAFSAAKVDPLTRKPILTMEWCQAPDRGLPAPDCVIFLDLSQEEAEKRGGYGGERYENREMQARVRDRFHDLQKLDAGRVPWKLVDSAKSVEEVGDNIWDIVATTLESVRQQGKPLGKMWEDGSYDLKTALTEEKEN